MNKSLFLKTFYVVLFLTLFLLPITVVTNPYWVHVLIMSLFNIGMAASLRLIFVAGELSLCHTVFMAIGGYTSALLVKNLGFSFWVVIPVAASTAALVAFFIGYVTLRTKGIYFVLVTAMLGEVVRLIIGNWLLLGAVSGLSEIPRPGSILGINFTSQSYSSYYYLVLLLTLLTLGICHRMEKSRYGLILRSIAQAPSISESVGINIMSYKVLSFVIACFMAGMLGSFYAHYSTIIHPDMFGLWQATLFLIYFQIGGVGRLWGAIIGGGFLTIIGEFLRATKHLEPVVFALLLIVIVLFMPEGLLGFPRMIGSLFSSLWEKKEVAGR